VLYIEYSGLSRTSWIRAIRDGLSMTAKQLADRLGSTQQNVARIERDELAGAVTMKTMKRIAHGLDCTFVYALVPNSTLESTLKKQVDLVVSQRLKNVSHSMSLENHDLSDQELEKVRRQMIGEYLEKLPSCIWDAE
jgi:predicted DNA-binding mobile mystery protein A